MITIYQVVENTSSYFEEIAFASLILNLLQLLLLIYFTYNQPCASIPLLPPFINNQNAAQGRGEISLHGSGWGQIRTQTI